MNKRYPAFIMALLTLISVASCASSGTEDKETSEGVTSQSTAEPEPQYEFRKDWDGETISFLNYDNPFGTNAKITVESENGDYLNDAEYKRMVALEENMGIKLEERNVKYEDYQSFARSTLAAAEDTYDFLYVNARDINSLVSDGYLIDLTTLDALNLREDWWLYEFNDMVTVDGKLYCAEGYSNLLTVDFITIALFNEDIAEKLSLDLPYGLVKDGKWTLDKFGEYLKVGASLNLGVDADDSDNVWSYDQPGNGAACSGLLISAGERVIEVVDGKLELTAGSERFYNVCDKIASIMSQNKDNMYNKGMYSVSSVFVKNQALLSYGEIATTQGLRSADFAFGVLPCPKYDEAQERYYGRKSWPSAGISIPMTAKDPEKSAAVADALNYISRETVWPVYRGIVLEQKNLRNEESIEMLDIILRSGVPALSTIYDVGGGLINSTGEKLMNGESDIASMVASDKSSIETALERINSGE